ncbi:unnamed protein product [Chrysoparadoxa australica]
MLRRTWLARRSTLRHAIRFASSGPEGKSDEDTSWQVDDSMNNLGNGKVFESERQLLKPEVSPIFPPLSGITTGNEEVSVADLLKDRVTLVGLSYRELGSRWTQPWIKAYIAAIGQNAPVLEVVCLDTVIMRALSWAARQGLRSRLRDTPNVSAVVVSSDTTPIRETLGIRNKLSGYLYLVDGQGRVRWAGCGVAGEDEISAMTACAVELRREEAQQSKQISQ